MKKNRSFKKKRFELKKKVGFFDTFYNLNQIRQHFFKKQLKTLITYSKLIKQTKENLKQILTEKENTLNVSILTTCFEFCY